MKATNKASRQGPTPRRKACDACSASKVRCGHESPCCFRCQQRGTQCIYPHGMRNESATIAAGTSNAVSPPNFDEASSIDPGVISPLRASHLGNGLSSAYLDASHGIYSTPAASTTASPSNFGSAPPLSYSESEQALNGTVDTSTISQHPAKHLVCNVDVTAIQNRWLKTYIPDPDHLKKTIPPRIEAYIGRMLKSYTSCIIHGSSLPPFVHEQQIRSSSATFPLTNCLNLMKLCDSPMAGSQDMVKSLLEQEMAKLYDQHASYNAVTLLAAFQAYFIYTMTMFFHLDQQSNSPALGQHMMNLQQLACNTSAQGLQTTAELDHSRPCWEAWSMVEAKRRTLYTMYLFDNLLCMKDGLPIFVSPELTGLPAPASRLLWSASSEADWKTAYNSYLSEWQQSGLRLDELWPIPSDLSQEAIAERRDRVDRWLECVDGYGTMLYAVTICTHGG